MKSKFTATTMLTASLLLGLGATVTQAGERSAHFPYRTLTVANETATASRTADVVSAHFPYQPLAAAVEPKTGGSVTASAHFPYYSQRAVAVQTLREAAAERALIR